MYSSSIYYDEKKKKYIAAYDIDSQVDLGDMQNHKKFPDLLYGILCMDRGCCMDRQ
ncbi:hypothetical protein E27107_10097 [Elizabethkingia anophelis]|nr:hypothetical protein E18064_440024 [Elizabethkingia anophelis]CDN76695.1 hypothetical protein E27107_10097 [Elizabethkingia anophelis]